MAITNDPHEAMGEGPVWPLPPSFTFSKCKDRIGCQWCAGSFYSRTRGRVYCACECHSDTAVSYYESQLER